MRSGAHILLPNQTNLRDVARLMSRLKPGAYWAGHQAGVSIKVTGEYDSL